MPDNNSSAALENVLVDKGYKLYYENSSPFWTAFTCRDEAVIIRVVKEQHRGKNANDVPYPRCAILLRKCDNRPYHGAALMRFSEYEAACAYFDDHTYEDLRTELLSQVAIREALGDEDCMLAF